MISPDPEEPTRPDAGGESASPAGTNRPPDGPPRAPQRRAELPADVDAAFASIVADWAANGAPSWPADPEVPEATHSHDDEPSAGLGSFGTGSGTATPPAGTPVSGPVDPAPARDPAPDDHFVPPDPPPLPRLGLSAILGIALLVAGMVLLALPGLMGGPLGLGIVPGLLSMTAGLGWLVFGLRRPRERGDGQGPDDGAVL